MNQSFIEEYLTSVKISSHSCQDDIPIEFSLKSIHAEDVFDLP